MKLDKHVIDMFTELTKPADNVKMEKTCYGTISVVDGTRYVKLDGSDLLVPAASTVKTSHGDRVTVLMRNHSLTITGNLTAPATDGGSSSTGTAATIEVGTVTTGAAGSMASVTNSGTESEAVFDFVIPKGDKGDKGEKGDTGTWDGTIPGHSHGVSDITDFPASLPANGGNADTVNGRSTNGNTSLIRYDCLYGTTDADTLISTGIYRGIFINYPSELPDGQGTLVVINYFEANNETTGTMGDTTNRWLQQWFITPHTNDVYYRSCVKTSVSDWVKVVKSSELSNLNQLINPDFKINQRGKTAYTTTGYTVDRWLMQVGFEITPLENGIRICPTRVPTSNLFAIIQHIPVSRAMHGNNYTLTVNVSATNDYAYAAVYAYDSADAVIRSAPKIKLNTGLNSTTIQNIPDNTAYIRVQITINSGAQTSDTLELLWTKLELGSISTPFVPPDPATELAKCQRYYQIRSTGDIPAVDLRPAMRITPTVTQLSDGNYAYSAEL